MTEHLLTPTKISAWLDCEHYLTLRRAVDDGRLERPGRPFGEFARLLMEKGQLHERECLAAYRAGGSNVLEVPHRHPRESFEVWAERSADLLQSDVDVLYQMPFVHEGVRGIADFLVREVGEDGEPVWEPVDAKLARSEAKPGHVLQLCFYAEAIAAATGKWPERMHLWLGSGELESIAPPAVLPYWRRLRGQLARLLSGDKNGTDTAPVPCAHCDFCEFNGVCDAEWRASDAIHFTAGLRGVERDVLVGAGVGTTAALSSLAHDIDGLVPARRERLQVQASLQVEARLTPGRQPPIQLLADHEVGFGMLPEPDAGDIFLDFEGHPFWRADRSLFFLFGYIANDGGEWAYHSLWAHTLGDEAAITQELVDRIAERRARYPDMHVYHYNHTERSALERLAIDHSAREAALATLVDTGCFIDLLPVVQHSLQIGIESYSLKEVEKVTGFERSHDIDRGAGAVVEYEAFSQDGDAQRLARIERYNADDVRATLAVRDWLVDRRPAIPWRAPQLEADPTPPDLDERTAALLATGESTHRDLAHALGYWLREWRAYKAPRIAKCGYEIGKGLADPEVIVGLEFLDFVEPEGRQSVEGARLTFPEQEIDEKLDDTAKLLFVAADGQTGYASVRDIGDRELTITWTERSRELGPPPSSIVLDDWVNVRPKPDAVGELADQLIAGTQTDHALTSSALLGNELPRIGGGHGPGDSRFVDDIDRCATWVLHLENSCLAMQGPPGTGKTYRGARIIRRLLDEGQRVGVTATSYAAIDNLLEAVLGAYDEAGQDPPAMIRKGSRSDNPELADRGVTFSKSNDRCASDDFALVGGTSWLFAGNQLAASPVDVLVIDEAGQYALADTLAALRSTRNLLLLGDPSQLPHVSLANHPEGSGSSVLAHVLGDDHTMPPERGVFLDESWRMHPDICSFISDRMYDGRLRSHPSCATQSTDFGTGLRWIEVDHADCSTESAVEADRIVAEIERIIGSTWIDQEGERRELTPADVMVVTPYNDQVRLLRRSVADSAIARGTPVGTVDKFQGQEAAVVFFSMTTSDADAMPRGPDFLFSANRLNVAISRARCLAYLVCTESLLDSRARSIREMELLSNLAAFVERAGDP